MLNKKLMAFAILLVAFLAVSTVNAADNATNDIVSTEETTDEIISIEDRQIILKENNAGTFTELNTTINGNAQSEIYLNKDYYYNISSDGDFKDGITIDRPVTIYGNGFTISGEYTARIFNVGNENVVLQDITFIKGKTRLYDSGGAIKGYSTAINCTFINNRANYDGGAMYEGAAYNCTFINNRAERVGGAMYYVSAYNCTFTNNKANQHGGAMYKGGDVYGCIFTNNYADRGGAMYMGGDVYGCIFINNTAEYGGARYMCDDAYDCIFTNNYADRGGAIYMSGDAYNCSFINNSANSGGAMYAINAYNCTFINNRANYDGGAMCDGDAYNCTFINNSANLDGGAMDYGSAYNCSFINNRAEHMGGAMDYGSAYDCIFINNTAEYGGAMEGSAFIIFYASSCQFIRNSATRDGGATYLITANNCNFTENTAGQNGGAMYAGVFAYCIFNGNIAGVEGNATYNTKLETTLTIPDVVTVYNTTGKVVATLKDAYGNVVSGVKVKIVVGSLSKTAKTNKNGQVSLDISGLAPGEYKISARSSATSAIYKEAKATAKAVVSSDKIDTTLTVSDVIVVGGSPAVVATLKDSYGNVVSGVNVRIVVGSSSITAKTDENGQVSLDISDLDDGEYEISARSSAKSNIYNEAKATAKAIVSADKIDTTLTVPIVVVVGGSPAVVATLKDCYGNVISGVNVKIVVGSLSKTAKTNKNGQVSMDISSLAPGEYKISARSSATNDIYKEAKVTAKAFVSEDKIDTTLTVPDVTVVAGSPAVVATLKDCYGNLVCGVNVRIAVGDLSVTAKTDANGQVSLDVSSLAPGEYVISARSSAKSKIYNEAKATANAVVYADKIDTILTIPDVTVVAGSPAVVATLKDSYGNVLSGINVKIVVGSLSKTAKTDKNGQVSMDISSLAPGEYIISARSSATNAIYKEAKTTANAIVKGKIASQLTADDLSIAYGENATLVVTLEDIDGNAIGNAVIYAYTIYNESYVFITDDEGKAYLSFNNLELGSYPIYINFGGNDFYFESNAVANILVNKASSKWDLNGFASFYYGNEGYIVATLKDVYGNPIPNVETTVRFEKTFAPGENEYYKTDTYITNNYGLIYINIASLNANDYYLYYNFAGNDYYASSSDYHSMTIQKCPTVFIIDNGFNSASYKENKWWSVKLIEYSGGIHDYSGDAIGNANVKVTFTGRDNQQEYVFNLKTSTGQDYGYAKLNTKDMAPGVYDVSVEFLGDDNYYETTRFYDYYEGSPFYSTFTITNNKANPTLTTTGVTTTYGTEAYVKAVLKDPNGNVMANRLVTFNFEDGTGRTVKTDSKGVAQLSTSGIDAGTYSITVTYAPESGSADYNNYNTVSSSVTMKINKADAILYAKTSTGYWIINEQGQTVSNFGINNKEQREIRIYVEDSNGNPIVGATVRRTGYGNSITDSNGIATFKLSYNFVFPYLNPQPRSVTETFTLSYSNYNQVSMDVPVLVVSGYQG